MTIKAVVKGLVHMSKKSFLSTIWRREPVKRIFSSVRSNIYVVGVLAIPAPAKARLCLASHPFFFRWPDITCSRNSPTPKIRPAESILVASRFRASKSLMFCIRGQLEREAAHLDPFREMPHRNRAKKTTSWRETEEMKWLAPGDNLWPVLIPFSLPGNGLLEWFRFPFRQSLWFPPYSQWAGETQALSVNRRIHLAPAPMLEGSIHTALPFLELWLYQALWRGIHHNMSSFPAILFFVLSRTFTYLPAVNNCQYAPHKAQPKDFVKKGSLRIEV